MDRAALISDTVSVVRQPTMSTAVTAVGPPRTTVTRTAPRRRSRVTRRRPGNRTSEDPHREPRVRDAG